MKKYLVFAIGAALLCGCEYNFDLDDTRENDKLYVLCIAGDNDETFINVQKAIPANRDDTSKPVKTNVTKLDLKVNGKSVSLSKYVDDSSVRYNLWRTTDKILPGDELSLEVEAEGTDPVKAFSYVPATPVIKDINISEKVGNKDYLKVVDVLVDNVSEDANYAFDCTERVVLFIEKDGVEVYRDTSYNSVWITDDVEYDEITSDTEDPWIYTRYNGIAFDSYDGHSLRVLDSRTMLDNGGHIKFAMDTEKDYVQERFEDWIFDEETGDWYQYEYSDGNRYHYSFSYSITVYRLSDNGFRYVKARYIEDNNVLATIGLAPATFTYSNIDGGFGVLAGMSKTETDYFKAE